MSTASRSRRRRPYTGGLFVQLAFGAAALWGAPGAAALEGPPLAEGTFEIPAPATPAAFSSRTATLLSVALLDLAALQARAAERVPAAVELSDVSLGPVRPAGGAPGTFLRDARVSVDPGAAEGVLAEALSKPIRARLAVARLERGHCRPDELAVAMALAVTSAAPAVTDEFGGLVLELCASRTVRRQCLVFQRGPSRSADCRPDVSAGDFDEHLCNRAHLDKRRAMMGDPGGAVACRRALASASVRWRLTVLPGRRPSAIGQSLLERSLRPYAFAAAKLIRAEAMARFLRRDPVVHGRLPD